MFLLVPGCPDKGGLPLLLALLTSPFPHLILTTFPNGLVKVLPCPTSSLIFTQLFTCSLHITLIMKAVYTSTLPVYFYEINGSTSQKAVLIEKCIKKRKFTVCNID
jgi:hypothetical protein